MTDKDKVVGLEQPTFSFLKGVEDVISPKDTSSFDWDQSATKVREHLNEAMNARNIAFLLGSGCSSFISDDRQLGIPTMGPLARTFIDTVGEEDADHFLTEQERQALVAQLGLDVTSEPYGRNLEYLMEVLYSFQFVLERSDKEDLKSALVIVQKCINKVIAYILHSCTSGAFSQGDTSVIDLYAAFYRRLIYRDRALPRPWVFTTNYDLFNETAMDRLGITYANGFSGTIERRFNPATFRYSLAEQLDISSRKWSAVDSFVYLCKLHGSVNWSEDARSLFPVREMQQPPQSNDARIMIYPTPAKQNASFASPYSDMFREFQPRVVREQSVLFCIGYSFGDEHVNNIIFQALTIPTFRLVAFVPPSADGVVGQLRALGDPRIWLIGGDGPVTGRKAHYFDTVIERFMPEPPGDKVDTAVAKVLRDLISPSQDDLDEGDGT